MSLAQQMLAEFEHEAQLTRPFLERLGQEHFAWKPHAKSMSAGQLALHLAMVPGGIAGLAVKDTVPAPNFGDPPSPSSSTELLNAFDASVAKVRELLPSFDDAALARRWSVEANGQTVLSLPRAAMLRSLMLSHWIQHRGQFAVYLRMLDIPVPATYGPSADEPPHETFREHQRRAVI